LTFISESLQNEATTELFYTSDIKILIDVVARELLSCREEAQVEPLLALTDARPALLECLRHVLLRTNYSSHRHRQSDLLELLRASTEPEEVERVRTAATRVLDECSEVLG